MMLTSLYAGIFVLALQAQVASLETPTSGDSRVLFRWTDYRAQINYGDRPPPDAQNVLKIDLLMIKVREATRRTELKIEL